jgi:hypothetical protein
VNNCQIDLAGVTFDGVHDFERTWNLEQLHSAADERQACREGHVTVLTRAGQVVNLEVLCLSSYHQQIGRKGCLSQRSVSSLHHFEADCPS